MPQLNSKTRSAIAWLLAAGLLFIMTSCTTSSIASDDVKASNAPAGYTDVETLPERHGGNQYPRLETATYLVWNDSGGLVTTKMKELDVPNALHIPEGANVEIEGCLIVNEDGNLMVYALTGANCTMVKQDPSTPTPEGG